MAGRIIANTIVPGYPEPGVTADEIVGLVNRYGLPLVALTSSLSKKYEYNTAGAAQYLVNTYPSIGPAYCSGNVTLESWAVPSNILVSVSAALYFTLSSPNTAVDDTTFAGVGILRDGEDAITAYGSIGQSAKNGAGDVGAHGFYEAFYVDSVAPGVETVITGKLIANGGFVTVQAEAGFTIYGIVKLKVLRVMA